MGTQRRMRGLSPSLVTSSITLAILGLGTSTASGDFLNRNFLDNLFSFSGAAQSADYPPNPCPQGYTAEDGCIEVGGFENRAEFSRKYQASQNCMCDSEHMFSCPDVNSFDSMYTNQQDPGLFGLDAITPLEDVSNPYLSGSKLPIAAKKGMGH